MQVNNSNFVIIAQVAGKVDIYYSLYKVADTQKRGLSNIWNIWEAARQYNGHSISMTDGFVLFLL